MIFRVQDLEIRPATFDVELAPEDLAFDDPKLKLAGPLKASGKVELVAASIGEIRASGKLAGSVIAECDRCLDEAAYPVASEFQLDYRPAPAGEEGPRGGVEHVIDAEDANLGFYEGDGVELNDILREQIYLELPMQRLCSEQCKGICPVCGQNRNKQDCQCDTSMVDDRWSALRQIQ